jgi:hypothetical protein
VTEPELRDELVSRAAADWQQAEAFFAAVDADDALARQLETLLRNPATPLLAVLPGWPACPPEGERLVEIVARNAHRLGEVVRETGWPGLSRVGADGADAAWLIAQHADLENDLRRGFRGPLEDAARRGEADPRHFASLVDRIAVVDGDAQVYGTVAVLEDGRPTFPHPLLDPPRLDARRSVVGLPPFDEDVQLLALGEIIPCGPDRLDHPLMRWPGDA